MMVLVPVCPGFESLWLGGWELGGLNVGPEERLVYVARLSGLVLTSVKFHTFHTFCLRGLTLL